MNNLQVGKVLWFCGTDDGRASDCVEWAERALIEGLDSHNLRILAGLEAPLNHFEVREYAEKALKDLQIELRHGEPAVILYAKDLAAEIISSPEKLRKNLNQLFILCHSNDYISELYDFYLLECAYTDFDYSDVQWYWKGATKENIDSIVLEECRKFLNPS